MAKSDLSTSVKCNVYKLQALSESVVVLDSGMDSATCARRTVPSLSQDPADVKSEPLCSEAQKSVIHLEPLLPSGEGSSHQESTPARYQVPTPPEIPMLRVVQGGILGNAVDDVYAQQMPDGQKTVGPSVPVTPEHVTVTQLEPVQRADASGRSQPLLSAPPGVVQESSADDGAVGGMSSPSWKTAPSPVCSDEVRPGAAGSADGQAPTVAGPTRPTPAAQGHGGLLQSAVSAAPSGPPAAGDSIRIVSLGGRQYLGEFSAQDTSGRKTPMISHSAAPIGGKNSVGSGFSHEPPGVVRPPERCALPLVTAGGTSVSPAEPAGPQHFAPRSAGAAATASRTVFIAVTPLSLGDPRQPSVPSEPTAPSQPAVSSDPAVSSQPSDRGQQSVPSQPAVSVPRAVPIVPASAAGGSARPGAASPPAAEVKREPAARPTESLTIACDPVVLAVGGGPQAGAGAGRQPPPPPPKDAGRLQPRWSSAAAAEENDRKKESSPAERSFSPPADPAADAELPTIGSVLAAGDVLLFRCALCPRLCDSASKLRAHFVEHARRTGASDAQLAAGHRLRRSRRRRVGSDGGAEPESAAEDDPGPTPARRPRASRPWPSSLAEAPSLQCDVCNKTLSSVTKLQVHLRMHSGERPHACSYCPKRCNDLGNLRKHEQLHFKPRPFKCDACRVTFWTALRLRAHRCHRAAPPRAVRARAASQREPDAATRDAGAPLVVDEPPAAAGPEAPAVDVVEVSDAAADAVAVVEISDAASPGDEAAAAAAAELDRGSEPAPLVPIECDVCGRRLLSLSGWQRHQRIHSGEQPYRCRYCDKTCNDSGNMRKHEAGHFKDRPYRCDTCRITFVNSWRLTQHVCKLKTESTPAPAEQPPAALPARISLPRGRHAAPAPRGTRTKRRDHVCPTCGKAMLSYASLEMHYRTHTGEKPFQCAVCGKRFSIQGNLVVHTRIHTGERPFQCEECGKMFMYQSHLKVHSRAHSGARPYQCQFCQKGFAASSSRRVHEETVHSEERKFICETCGAGFKERKHLKRHRWKKHQPETDSVM